MTRRSAPLASFLAAVLLLGACGVKGPPVPPAPRRPRPARAVEVRQEGRDLWVAFRPPKQNADGKPLALPLTYEILALVSARPAGAAVAVPAPPPGGSPAPPPAGAQVDPRTTARLMKSARVAKRGVVPAPGERLEVRIDPGRLAGVRPEASRLTFGVALIDGRGRRVPPGRVAVIDPVRPLPPPAGLRAELDPSGVTLVWTLPELSAYGGEGFAIAPALYRRRAGEPRPSRPVVRLEPGSTRYHDTEVAPLLREETAEPVRLSYFVRLAAGEALPRRESVAAGPVEVEMRDRFPPAPPRGLSAVAEGGIIRLFWYPSEEPDLAGYRLYRAADGEEFARLTERMVTTTFHEDRDVTPGVRYAYRVSAVDRARPPNESGPSEEAFETAPDAAGEAVR